MTSMTPVALPARPVRQVSPTVKLKEAGWWDRRARAMGRRGVPGARTGARRRGAGAGGARGAIRPARARAPGGWCPEGKKKRERGTNPPSRNVHAEDPRSRRVARGAVDAPLYPMSSSSFFAGVERALSFMTRSTCEDDGGVATVSEGVSNGGGVERGNTVLARYGGLGAGAMTIPGSGTDPGERARRSRRSPHAP